MLSPPCRRLIRTGRCSADGRSGHLAAAFELAGRPPPGVGSLYDALAEGRLNVEALLGALAQYRATDHQPVYAVDVSVWSRCDAEASPDRGFYYHPLPSINRLTPREREVLQALAAGLSDCEIAHQFFVSTKTVRTHMVNVLRKLEVDSRLKAVVFAVNHGR